MKSEFDGQIEQAKKGLGDLEGKIRAERKRLSLEPSEEYWDLLVEEKELKNKIILLEAKKRLAILEKIASEISPLLDELRDKKTDEARRIEIVLELTRLVKAANTVKTNFVILERRDSVQVELIDENLRLVYGQTAEMATSSLKRIRDDVLVEQNVKTTLKDPNEAVLIDLPYSTAKGFEEKGKGKIVQIGEPIFREVIKDDPELPIIRSASFLNLGEAVPGKDGKYSPQAEALMKRGRSGPFQISVQTFWQWISESEVKKIAKRFE